MYNKEKIYSSTILTQMSGRNFVDLIRLTIRDEVKAAVKQEFKTEFNKVKWQRKR